MFEKIKKLFTPEPPYVAVRTRVHRKNHAKLNHYWLIVTCNQMQNAVQVPNGTSEQKIKEVEKMLVKQIREAK